MEENQSHRRPDKTEVREYRGVRRRHSGFRIPFGFLAGIAAVALILQWAGIVDLGIPIGPGTESPRSGQPTRPGSMQDAQSDLRQMAQSAASMVRGKGQGQEAAGSEGPPPPAGTQSHAPAQQPLQQAAAADDGPGGSAAQQARRRPGSDAAITPVEMPTDPSAIPRPQARADGYRSEVERAWFNGGRSLSNRALSARTRALQLGAGNYEAAARAMLAPKADGTRLERSLLAVRLSPDLPMARMELAAANLEEGQYLTAAREAIAGVEAIPRNLEATLWLAASLLAMFAAVLTLGSMTFIVWVGVSVFRHAAHDFGDLVSRQMPEFARVALLGSVMLVPVVLGEALMGVVLGLFLLGFSYCEAGYRRALALAAVLMLLGIYPVTRLAGVALTSLDSDPVAAAADAVVRSMTAPGDVATLASAAQDDGLAEAALALHERRSGDSDVAKARYERLLAQNPTDPVVLAVLSNMHFERGNNEQAIKLGERAAALTRSATLLFNLSQVYARSFRMDEFEGAMAQAQLVNASVVADLSRTKAPDFVADLGFRTSSIRDRMIQRAGGERFVDPVSRAIMPGRIGERWQTTAAVFAAAAVLGLLIGGRWERASNCRRCGRRICGRCDGTVWNSQICDGCHHLFHRPETTDPAMRMARLGELRARETRVGRLVTAASLLVPGVAGLVAKRPDLSFLGLVFFAWAVVLVLWRDGVVVDPLAIGAAGPLLFGAAAGTAVLGYALIVGLGLMIRRNL